MAEQQKTAEQLEIEAKRARMREIALKGDGRGARTFEFGGEQYGVRSPTGRGHRDAVVDAKKVSGTEDPDPVRLMARLVVDMVVDAAGKPVFHANDFAMFEGHALKGSFQAAAWAVCNELLKELGGKEVEKKADEVFTPADPS